MIRSCDGKDPNLIGPPPVEPSKNRRPCVCRATFDDVRWSTIWPHQEVAGVRTIGGCTAGQHVDPHRGCEDMGSLESLYRAASGVAPDLPPPALVTDHKYLPCSDPKHATQHCEFKLYPGASDVCCNMPFSSHAPELAHMVTAPNMATRVPKSVEPEFKGSFELTFIPIELPLHVLVAEALGCKPYFLPAWRAWLCGCEDHQHACDGVDGAPREGVTVEQYDTDWAATGPLIERFRIELFWTTAAEEWRASLTGDAYDGRTGRGETQLLAVCDLILTLKADFAGRFRECFPA